MSYKVQSGGYTFSLEPDAPRSRGKLSFPLDEFLPKDLSKGGLADLKRMVDQKAESVWVQSRLMVVFAYAAPEEDEADNAAMLEANFQAFDGSVDDAMATPFSCCDERGRAQLRFDDKVKKEHAKKIATAFWKVLLSEPSELDDYEAEVRDQNGARIPYGVRDGRCFFGETSEDADVPGEGSDFDFDPVGMADGDDDWLSAGFEEDEDEDDLFDDDDDDLFGDDDDDRY